MNKEKLKYLIEDQLVGRRVEIGEIIATKDIVDFEETGLIVYTHDGTLKVVITEMEKK